MEDIWLKLVRDGLGTIKHIVQEGFQENVSLEFKQKKDPTTGEFDREDQKNLGRALSAFSNSVGGLLIWGVICRKEADGVDRARDHMPIQGLNRFLNIANDLIGQYLSPKNEHIEVLPIFLTEKADTGYLAIRIPRSERRPHRSEVQGDKHYYKRAGASSFIMEHYDVEDAFRRNSDAVLDLRYSVHTNGGGSIQGISYTVIKIILSLENSSRSSAIYPYLSVVSLKGAFLDDYGLDGNGAVGLERRVTRNVGAFFGGADTAIHPNQVLDVAALKLKIVRAPIPDNLKQGHFPDFFQLDGHQIEVTCEVGSLNAPIQASSFKITNEYLTKLISSGK